MENKKSPTSKIIFQGIGKPTNVHGYTAPPPVYGCTNPAYLEYDPLANVDDGSCSTLIVYGCTDSTAFNYDSNANVDDGSCVPVVLGCTDSTALNYNPLANTDDGSCIPIVYGCTDPNATNYDSLANVDNGSCIVEILGCTDPLAVNYNPNANTDDGSCSFEGCTDPSALNYNSLALTDDGSCTYTNTPGCTNNLACNYDPLATVDDGSCILPDGCTDNTAFNYDNTAVCDDGSCITALPPNNVPDVTLILNPHTSFFPLGPSTWLGNGSNQNIQMFAAPNSGSYPPNNYSFTIDFSNVTPYGGSSYNTLNQSGTWNNSLGYASTIATNDDQYPGLHNFMPTTSGTITVTWTFEWENGNGGTIIYTITQALGTAHIPVRLDIVVGCTDPNAFNYTLSVPPTNWEDASCVPIIYGCTDPDADNYYQGANVDSGNCVYVGCTNPDADNYNPLATIDDGSCLIPGLDFNPINPGITVHDSDESSYQLTNTTTSTLLPVTSTYYAKLVFLNLHNTISGHRTGASSGNNEPYIGVFEYSLGCGGTTALFDTDGTTYIGAGWGDEVASGIDDYQSLSSYGVNQGSVAIVEPTINGAGLSNNPDFPEPSQYVSPSFTSDPSGFTPYPAYFLDPHGATVVVAIIPYSSHPAFGYGADLHYAFKFKTTDDYGDDKELIYSLIVHEDGSYTDSLFEPTTP